MLSDFRYGLRVLRKAPGFTDGRRADAGARHRRQRGDVQPRQWRAPAQPAVPGTGSALRPLHDRAAVPAHVVVLSELPRLEPPRPLVHEHGRVPERELQPDRPGRARARAPRDGLGGVLSNPRREACRRADIRPGRRPPGRDARRDSQHALLEGALRRRPVDRRPRALAERRLVHGDRRGLERCRDLPQHPRVPAHRRQSRSDLHGPRGGDGDAGRRAAQAGRHRRCRRRPR